MLDFGYYNMDCMDGMKEFPDKYFDLAIVDPPYGIGEGDGRNHFSRGVIAKGKEYKRFYDKEPPPREHFIELSRVSKNQIIFGANHFADRLPNPSSSCWIACHNTGHKFVGFERDEYYYKVSKERLAAETAQMNLFEFIK